MNLLLVEKHAIEDRVETISGTLFQIFWDQQDFDSGNNKKFSKEIFTTKFRISDEVLTDELKATSFGKIRVRESRPTINIGNFCQF